MLKLISFIYFLRQLIVSSHREKKSPCLLILQKVFSPVKLDRSFLFSSCGNAILDLKAALVRFTFSRNSVVHKNFSCWIYLSLKAFCAIYFLWSTLGNNLLQKNCFNMSVGRISRDHFSCHARRTDRKRDNSLPGPFLKTY